MRLHAMPRKTALLALLLMTCLQEVQGEHKVDDRERARHLAPACSTALQPLTGRSVSAILMARPCKDATS